MQDHGPTTTTEQQVPGELVQTIESNPEEVALLVEWVGLISDLIDMFELNVGVPGNEMVWSFVRTGTPFVEVVDDAFDPDAVTGTKCLPRAAGDTGEVGATPVGMVGLLRAVCDPEVKAELGYLVALTTALGAGMDEK